MADDSVQRAQARASLNAQTPNDTQAQGGTTVDPLSGDLTTYKNPDTSVDSGTKDAVTNQLLNASYKGPGGYTASDNATQGVGDSMGLLGHSGGPNPGSSMGMTTPDDLSAAFDRNNQRMVGDTVAQIQRQEALSAPLRTAQRQMAATQTMAKTEQLRLENWALKNQQAIQKKQIQNAYDAQKSSWLSTLIGGIGMVGGAVAGGLIAGPAGALAGANVGGTVGGKTGQAIGG